MIAVGKWPDVDTKANMGIPTSMYRLCKSGRARAPWRASCPSSVHAGRTARFIPQAKLFGCCVNSMYGKSEGRQGLRAERHNARVSRQMCTGGFLFFASS